LAQALNEMQKFGYDYGLQIVKNAKTLAQALADYGFNVLGENHGFTETHQVLVDVGQGEGPRIAKILEQANIIVNENIIPGDGIDPRTPRGIRLGTQEMTRFGMKESEMEQIAKFIKEIVLDCKDPEKVKPEVIAFRQQFQTIKFC